MTDEPMGSRRPGASTPLVSKEHHARNRAKYLEHFDWLKLLFLHAGLGALLGVLVAGALLYFDVAGLWRMISKSDHAFGFVLLLVAGFASTFGSLVVGTRIIMESDDTP